jgi:hypothetical protein
MRSVSTSLIVRHHDGETEGIDPRSVPTSALETAGHSAAPILKIIRDKCIDCCCGQLAEVRKCTAVGCALWPYRLGFNPFRDTTKNRIAALKNPGNFRDNFGTSRHSDAEVPSTLQVSSS